MNSPPDTQDHCQLPPLEIRNDVVEYDDGYNRLCLNDNSFALRECSMCGAASYISPTGHLRAGSEGNTTKVRVEEFTIKKGLA